MKCLHTICVGLACIVLAGCSTFRPTDPSLTPGDYTLVSVTTDIPDDETEHDEIPCTVWREGEFITVRPVKEMGIWLDGRVVGKQVSLTLRHEKPDPMIKAMQLRTVLEGEVNATDTASGQTKGYTGEHQYIEGTWSLIKRDTSDVARP